MIKSIEVGWGENSTYFTTEGVDPKVNKIIQEYAQLTNKETIIVYRGYKENKLIFEIFGNCQIIIYHK